MVVLVVRHGGQALEVGADEDVGLGHLAAVGDVEGDVEEEQEPGPTGIDDPGLGQHRKHLRGPGEGVVGPVAGGLEHRDQVAAAGGGVARRLGRLAHDREDGALDRLHHGAVGGRGGLGEATGELGGPGGLPVAQHVGEPAQDLGEDHTGVPTRAHERAVADRLAGRRHAGTVAGGGQLLAHRTDGEGHVGAGVAVGDRIDVEPVDRLAVAGEGVPVALDDRPHGGGVESIERRRHRAGIVGGDAVAAGVG